MALGNSFARHYADGAKGCFSMGIWGPVFLGLQVSVAFALSPRCLQMSPLSFGVPGKGECGWFRSQMFFLLSIRSFLPKFLLGLIGEYLSFLHTTG